MVGVVVKPISQLDVSAYANFVGRRTYATTYGSERLSDRLTINAKVDYRPTPSMSLFFSVENLLGQERREFVYADKIGRSFAAGLRLSLKRD